MLHMITAYMLFSGKLQLFTRYKGAFAGSCDNKEALIHVPLTVGVSPSYLPLAS